jgi:hypothetical protein
VFLFTSSRRSLGSAYRLLLVRSLAHKQAAAADRRVARVECMNERRKQERKRKKVKIKFELQSLAPNVRERRGKESEPNLFLSFSLASQFELIEK